MVRLDIDESVLSIPRPHPIIAPEFLSENVEEITSLEKFFCPETIVSAVGESRHPAKWALVAI
jgi:hypothetical protein